MKLNIEDVRYWPIVNFVPTSVLKNIRLIYVLGHVGSDVLLATNEDELLVFGLNKSGCLVQKGPQYDSQYDDESLEKIEELSKKRVKGFAYNAHSHKNKFIVAYLENGEVYFWGHDRLNNDTFTSPSLIDKLPKTVTEVACGIGHILALTSSGEVFGWGDNSKKQITYLTQGIISTPTRISDACVLSSKQVIKIACGFHFSVVVTSEGAVYSWGQNDAGQLGLNKLSKFESGPREIESLRYTCIENIACGSNHVLALDNHGDMFSWGSNDYRQLGEHIGANKLSLPWKLNDGMRLKEIAASNNLSIGINFYDVVYVWGQIAGEPNPERLKTPCRTIDEAFALYNCGYMYKAIEIASENETVSETMGKSCFNKETSDFKFIVGGRELHVHKTVLILRSQYFKRMFNEHWVGKNQSSAEINESFVVMFGLLKYLYTDKLVTEDPYDVLRVAILANKYCESNLVNVCLRKFQQNLVEYNLTNLYELAYENNMMNFCEVCIDFASYHLPDIITSEGFDKWKVDTYRSFFKHPKIIKASKK